MAQHSRDGNVSANGSPNSAYWNFDLAYLPFMNGGPDIWPWFNARIGIQYTHYDKFDGTWNNVDTTWPEGGRQRSGLRLHLADVLAQEKNTKEIFRRSAPKQENASGGGALNMKTGGLRVALQAAVLAIFMPVAVQAADVDEKTRLLPQLPRQASTKGSSDTTSLRGSPGSRLSILRTSSRQSASTRATTPMPSGLCGRC